MRFPENRGIRIMINSAVAELLDPGCYTVLVIYRRMWSVWLIFVPVIVQ